MGVVSAGILPFKKTGDILFVFLVHPGGPFFQHKDAGYWSIAKGEQDDQQEDLLTTARREFEEETGVMLEGEFLPLGSVKQKGGKVVHAWAVHADIDAGKIISNTFPMEWPPRSGTTGIFPEIDAGGWFDCPTAMQKINAAQKEFISRLLHLFTPFS